MPPRIRDIATDNTSDIHSIGELRFDQGVPLLFRANQQVIDSPHRWRFGNNQTSLLELIISPSSRILYGVTLILIDTLFEVPTPFLWPNNVPSTDGLPIVADVAKVPDTLSNPEPFRVFLADRTLYVTLLCGPPTPPVIQSGPIIFGINNGLLAGFCCPSLPEEINAQVINLARRRVSWPQGDDPHQ